MTAGFQRIKPALPPRECRKQLDLTLHFPARKPRAGAGFGGDEFRVVGVGEALDHDFAGIREKIHFARVDAAQILGGDGNALGVEVAQYKLGIAAADQGMGKSFQDIAAAENFGFKTFS